MNIYLPSKQRTRLLAFLLFYGACLFCLLPQLSLWLDEIIDLIGVRDYNFTSLMDYVPRSSGGVPLGYIAQLASVKLLGFSAFSARLPSAMFSLAACVGIAFLAKRMLLRWPVIAVILFATFPLQLRYALEARPYAQALCLTVWATIAFFAILKRPNFRLAAVYTTLIVAGLYTQPFTLFVPLTHLIWACLLPASDRKRRLLLAIGLAIVVASLAFLPWYLYANQLWRESIGEPYAFSFRSVLMILREMTGAGYLGTALVLGAAYLGLRGGGGGSILRTVYSGVFTSWFQSSAQFSRIGSSAISWRSGK